MNTSKRRLLLMARLLALVAAGWLLMAGDLPAESALIGEWSGTGLYATARLTYRANHTYVAQMQHREFGRVEVSGVWRMTGRQLISRDSKSGENIAEILKVTAHELELKAPDGMIWTYRR